MKACPPCCLAQTASRTAAGSGPRAVALSCRFLYRSRPFRRATPALFNQHLAWLKAHCRVVPFSLLGVGEGPQRPAAALTFDDGYADNRRHAAPVPAKHRLPGTFFITSGLMEKDPAAVPRFDRERGNGLRRDRAASVQADPRDAQPGG
jgi:hypothetical protein